MTEEIETHDTANEEARHGNREALEAMTKRVEDLERKLAKAVDALEFYADPDCLILAEVKVKPMTDLEHTANEEARHGNREALEAMTKRVEDLERKLAEAVALALKECPYRHGTETYDYWWQARRDDIAELKGEKP